MKKLVLVLGVGLLVGLGYSGAPSAHASHAAEFSMEISAAACNTKGGPTTCEVPAGSQFTVSVSVNDFSGLIDWDGDTITGYREVWVRLLHSAGLTLKNRPGVEEFGPPDAPFWPDCESRSEAKNLAEGSYFAQCEKLGPDPVPLPPDLPESTHRGLVLEADYTCPSLPSSGHTVTMLHDTLIGPTILLDEGFGGALDPSPSETLTIDCVATGADVAITAFDCAGPPKIQISETGVIDCTAILHNFGPDPIELGAALSFFAIAPPGCDTPPGLIFDFLSLPVSEDLAFPVSFPVHCSERGLHTFEFTASVGVGVEDPDLGNNTASATVSVQANRAIKKDPRLANLWLCNVPGAPTCDNKASGVEEVNLNVDLNAAVSSISPKGDPQTIGSFEFQVRYDAKLVAVHVEPGELFADRGDVSCAETHSEGFVQFRCVTKGKESAVSGPGTLAVVRVRATPDVYSILIPNQGNGIATQLINQDCNLADLQGHPIEVDACDDAAVTIRYLEGDVHADCVVDVHDQQQISFRWGARLGNLLYNSRFDLEPSAPKKGDGDIDAKDLQAVYGRHGSTCKAPHPPQPPVDPKAKVEPPSDHDIEILSFDGSSSTPGDTPQTYTLRIRNNSPVSESVQVGFQAFGPSLDPSTVTMAPGAKPPGSFVFFGPGDFGGRMTMAVSVPLAPGAEGELTIDVTLPLGFGSAVVTTDACHEGDPVDGEGRGFSGVGLNCTGVNDGFLDANPANDAGRTIDVVEGPKP